MGLSGPVEPTVKYHPDCTNVLTGPVEGLGQGQVGSLTGAVSS